MNKKIDFDELSEEEQVSDEEKSQLLGGNKGIFDPGLSVQLAKSPTEWQKRRASPGDKPFDSPKGIQDLDARI